MAKVRNKQLDRPEGLPATKLKSTLDLGTLDFEKTADLPELNTPALTFMCWGSRYGQAHDG